jgi:putative GTP pyrophosphokinase
VDKELIANRLRAWLDVSGGYILKAATQMPDTKDAPPWGSKGQLNRAGDAIRTGSLSPAESTHVDAWRAAHRYVLNTFQSILRNKARARGIDIAQRPKRRTTIVDKLVREPKMLLSRMDDVAVVA